MKKVIGIDIGGTKILGGLINEKGTLIESIKVPTNALCGRDAIINSIFSIINKLMDKEVKGIGVGSAGRINYNKGIVDYATDNLPGWTNLNIKKTVETKYKIPVIADNDVNTAVLGEHWIGSALGYKNIIMITLGTGVGGAVICDNKLVRGKHFSTGEIGHTVIYPDGIECNCGKKGCLEQYVSGNGITKRYNKMIGGNKVNKAEEVFELYIKEDNIANLVVNEAIKTLAIAINNLRNILDPEIFIIGGGLINSKEIWWDSFILQIDKDIKINSALLSNKATMYGAAKLILKYL
ncbi:N-acylmannosamine kinase [Vallitalea longa]|uniref:N-acylmannosamine kinase n=1 Tax=Vallitalea longa TaxID=2936439 RepID=A0A9W5YAL0_9FIRM|nr:ROK family protein [Vallitalea longa]GKX29952.1 N-acylmannosamine kinase [Vallitalea longa]